MGVKHNVFIQHACMFTREGIKSTLVNSKNNFEVIDDVANLEVSTYQSLYEKEVSVFILELQNNTYSHGYIIDFVMRLLPIHFPRAQVLIMTQTYPSERLKNYLLGMDNVAAVLYNGMERQELLAHLKRIIEPQEGSVGKSGIVTPLSFQESKVLAHLLNGVPVLKIASTLSINQKTVSAHKRAAMKKVGVTSLHGLMRCDFREFR